MERHELEAWLGPALDQLTPEQVSRLHREAGDITARYPDPDDADDREAALTAATQYLLGELTVEEAGRRRRETMAAERHARVQAIQVAAMAEADGMPTAVAARAAGIDRQVLIRRRAGRGVVAARRRPLTTRGDAVIRGEYRLVIAGIEWTILRAEPRTEHILRGVVPYPAHIPTGMDRVMARWGYERVTRWEEGPEGRLTAELIRVR